MCWCIAITLCKLANVNTWLFKFFTWCCYRIRRFLNNAETMFFNCVNTHSFGIQGEVVHLKSCLCDMLLMPLVRLEKRRRTTSCTACKCQSGWKTGQLKNDTGVGKVKGKSPFLKLSYNEERLFKKM